MNLAPGSGVQLTPWGFSALGDASGVQSSEAFAPAVAPVVESGPDGDEYDGPPDASLSDKRIAKVMRKIDQAVVAHRSVAAVKPRDVLRLARQRVREIRKELKRHEALKRELKQLENMLSAAKPLASVRALDSARRSAG